MVSSHKTKLEHQGLTVWRLVTQRFVDSAFDGEGARLYGGRWNKKGTPIIYTAATQSLAMLEMLVQDKPLRAHYMIIPAHIPSDFLVEQFAQKILPIDPLELQHIGSQWIMQQTSAVLAVPSSVIPSENNYLMNPTHPDFKKIHIGKPLPFVTDARLLQKT